MEPSSGCAVVEALRGDTIGEFRACGYCHSVLGLVKWCMAKQRFNGVTLTQPPAYRGLTACGSYFRASCLVILSHPSTRGERGGERDKRRGWLTLQNYACLPQHKVGSITMEGQKITDYRRDKSETFSVAKKKKRHTKIACKKKKTRKTEAYTHTSTTQLKPATEFSHSHTLFLLESSCPCLRYS